MSKANPALVVRAPLQGWCLPLGEVPDAAFRERLLGDGMAIDPTGDSVVAPLSGVVTNLPESAHSVTITAASGATVLVHVGIDTVGLNGNGFERRVRAGDTVTAGQTLITFDLDTLARGAPSLVSPVILMGGNGAVVQNFRKPGPVAAGDALFEVAVGAALAGNAAAAPVDDAAASASVRVQVRVTLPHGVHARPAAEIAAALADLDANVLCRSTAGGTADARSPIALMRLGVRAHEQLALEARGAHAELAVRKIADVLGKIETMRAGAGRVPPRVCQPPAPGDIISGLSAVGGLAAGTAVSLRRSGPGLRRESAGAVAELAVLRQAIVDVRRYLAALGGSDASREIAAAHAAFLGDPELLRDAERRIDEGGSAPVAWNKAIGEAADSLESLPDARMRQRAVDLRDVGLRMQRVMAGLGAAESVALEEDSIIVAEDLLPSQLMEMDAAKLAGICLARGGTSSHVAILAATLDVPMIVAAGEAVCGLRDGTSLLLDAGAGELRVAADRSESERFRERIRRAAAEQQHALATAHEDCVMADGTRVQVLANVASAADARQAVANGAEGCGLLRTEFLFMGRDTAPTADEQSAACQTIVDAFAGQPVVIRLLDAGGDKRIAFLAQASEENPALGVRGIRLLLAEPALLDGQLDGLLRIRHGGALRLLVPMVATLAEIEAVRVRLDRAQARAADGRPPELGVMIETPAAALLVDSLAPHVDFFSIGTNDLTQYVLAMDRGAASQALDSLHPAVLRLIANATEAASAAGRPISVCGGAAADARAAAVLIGLGIRQLSVVPAAVPRLKAAIRRWSVADCRRLAADALQQASAANVRALAGSVVDAPAVRAAGDNGGAP